MLGTPRARDDESAVRNEDLAEAEKKRRLERSPRPKNDRCARRGRHRAAAAAADGTMLLVARLAAGHHVQGGVMANVFVSEHPLVSHQLTLLRDRSTEPQLFRVLVRELSRLLFAEATRDLRLLPRRVVTPLAEHVGHRIAEAIGLVPILRAGLGMAESILDMVPWACVWHLGLYRDEQTRQPVTYYNKLPPTPNFDLAVVVDPMLATGGSAVAAIRILKDWNVRRIKFLGLIAAPEGVAALSRAHPDVPIHLAAVDSHLNEQCFIVPGLGDAGDRQFGTS
ncbi:MAG: uracil phosphoribosyltransferase [Gemmataceae bacterium]|nr:uracil phosphoribosyltransferase [Gemmataceae bacterium]MDW8263832.1 uracil phosphoribosyltransferase [Gemmataceae bacterium]